MMEFAPVRIRARSGQIENEGPDKDKWAFEVSLWTLDGETMVGEPFGPYGTFDTQDEAIAESRKMVELISKEMSKRMNNGQPSDKYFDLKNGGVLRDWKEN